MEELIIPADFEFALNESNLMDKFQALAPSHKKEYINSILDAKKAETRIDRIVKAIEMIRQI